VTLHAGDVEWWDYRPWTGSTMSVPVVVGAYPQPFLGAATSVIAVGVPRTVAAAIARQVHGTVSATKPTRNTIVASTHFVPDQVRISRARSGYRLELGLRAARRLAADQTAFRYRYGDAQ
jgi:anti-sigma factor RsiW